MSFFDIFRVSSLKKQIVTTTEELASLKVRMADAAVLSDIELRERSARLEEKIATLASTIASEEAELAKVSSAVVAKSAEVVQLDDAILLQEFGLYKPKYALANTAAYKLKLDVVRDEQARQIRDKTAATSATNWSINGDEREGRRMIADYTKLIVRAFNNECDTTIEGVKFSNLDTCRKRIRKSHELFNKLGARMSIAITPAYLQLKLQELELCFEYQVKKQEEKEEQRKIREREREEAKLAREIEEAKQALAKEEKHFNQAKATLQKQLEKADSEAERALCEKEIAAIESKLAEVADKQKDVDYREANAKAGYVYIISNIGAFGEGVFKIGVTRRLDPTERIDELGDASVPFDFDVHALVFSDDAFALEAALHSKFDLLRVNRMNSRKEFFRAAIDDIETTLVSHFQKPVEFTRLADAAEYRQGLKLIEDVTPAGHA